MGQASGLETRLAEYMTAIDLANLRRPADLPHPPLATLVRQAHGRVDEMMRAIGERPDELTDLRGHIAEVERLSRRVDAIKLRLTARAATTGATGSTGHTDTGSWLAGATGSDRNRSASDAMLAEAMGELPSSHDNPGAGTETQETEGDPREAQRDASDDQDDASAAPGDGESRPRLTLTGAALDAGEISADHAKVILRGLDDLPEGVTDDQRRECEAELLRLAANRSPSQLRRAARRVLATYEPDEAVVDQHEDDLVAREEEAARERSAFWVKDNRDGTMTGQFTVPWVSGMMLKKVIDAMTAPRRRATDGHDAGGQCTGAGAGPAAGTRAGLGPAASAESGEFGSRVDAGRLSATDRSLDWQHRRGLAFADLLMRIPTDHLHSKVSATMLITTRVDDLLGGLVDEGLVPAGTRVGSTDVHDVISAGTARRLACGAGLLPTVLDGESVPLDLGRQRRLFTDNQRMALATRYDECAAEGCDRPFAWTEVHHLRPWEAGGFTDLDNAAPLCGTHHHMIDSALWRHVVTQLGNGTVSLAFHRRT
ncbi:hypothetical protein DUHN55_39100 [Helicobacter pylori]